MYRLRSPAALLKRILGFLAIVAVTRPTPGHADPSASPQRLGYNRDVRPILSDRCFFCHGPDKAKRKAGLRLDVREAAIADDAIVPGKPDDSELIRRVTARAADDVMPPPDSHKTLTAEQIAVLRRWIEEGAAYEPHWFYVPVARRPLPSGAVHPVDAFVRAALDAHGVSPSPEADRRTLLRRLALDVTGLPPSSEEIDAFVRDARPDAWERQVDRLLASPAFGERMAVPWLDVVRFADTVGYHGDQNVHVFPYRDWVIDAFNRNERFDRFTIAQLAGDLLPHRTQADVVASGFNRLNMVTREGGAQPKEYLAKYAADRVRTVSAAWMGSTLGCAECHDHKYDPFTSADFYSMAAFFADIKQWGVYHDYSYTPNPDLRGWSNDHPFPPELTVKSPLLASRARELRAQTEQRLVEEARRMLRDRQTRAEVERWRDQALVAWRAHRDGARVVVPTAIEGEPAAKADGEPKVAGVVDGDGTVRLTKAPPTREFRDWGAPWVRLKLTPGPDPIVSMRVELPRIDGHVVRPTAQWGKLRISAAVESSGTKQSRAVSFAHADAPARLPDYKEGQPVTGIDQGAWKLVDPEPGAPTPAAWFQLASPLVLAPDESLVVKIETDDVLAFRVSVSALPRFGVKGAPRGNERVVPFGLDLGRVLTRAASDPAVVDAFLQARGEAAPAGVALRASMKALIALRDGFAETVVTERWQPTVTRVLARGNWQDESGPVVTPAVPHFLPQLTPATGRATRLDLARWLVDGKNPLTARVTMNRLWKQFFGTGLSSNLGDLGAQGELPSHPELLDWLASELVRSGWDVKAMVRLIVTSATYKQRSAVRPELRQLDPDNRWLARQSARRLDAEFVRDNALAISGLLDRSIGGPSVFPYQPDGHWDNLNFPVRSYAASSGRDQHRRGVYVHWQRTFLHPMLTSFDAPSREECVADRLPSNSPQQALTLLNDPTFYEAARVFAARVMQTSDATDATRVDRAVRAALGRDPSPSERTTLLGLLVAERAQHRAHAEDAARMVAGSLPPGGDATELAAWISVARVLFNLHEFITRT